MRMFHRNDRHDRFMDNMCVGGMGGDIGHGARAERGEGRGEGRGRGRGHGFAGGGFGGGFGRGGFGPDGGGRDGFGPGGFGPDGFGGPRGGPGGGRRGKRFEGEELRLMVLGLIGEEPRHGYQLIRAFAEKSGQVYQPSPGVLYPLLTMLADMDLVEEVENPQGGSRRSYRLTAAGQSEVETHRETIDALFARLAAFAEMAGRTDGAPVRRAVHNLRVALVERLGRDGTGEEVAFEVARLIDEVTQKIERL